MRPPVYRRILGTIKQVAPFLDDFVLEPRRLNPREIQLDWRAVNSDYLLGPHQLSDGTLRMIALTTLLLQPEADLPPLIVLDEPELGLRAGADGLDLVLRILRDAPLHLTEDGLLVCEVGEAERALVKLLPELPLAWIEFKVGQMGVFVAERQDLVAQHARIEALAAQREGGAAAATPSESGGLF